MPTITELLDPERWGDVLESYAQTVQMAVALVDHDGRLVGTCHNPQPVWSLCREARPEWGPFCPMCLDDNEHCSAAADAGRTGRPVLVSGLGGYVHIAAPVFLDHQHVGTLLAGQVFDRYPEMLMLERVAREFGLSGQTLWDNARRGIPVSRMNLTIYGNLLFILGQAFLRECQTTILQRALAGTNVKLQTAKNDLEVKVAQLDQSVVEKGNLLIEVHHRVNNNLQVIGSLLRMQATASPDAKVADALRDSQLRVDAMAQVHAQLYQSADLRAVDFAEYSSVLVGNLFRAYGVDETRVAWRMEIERLELPVEQALPVGLILNELTSNALKYAFPNGRSGSILIKGGVHGGVVELMVQDDGVGMVPANGPGLRQPLGMKIVNILTRQLKGTLEQPQAGENASKGCTFRISFEVAHSSAGATSG